MSTYARFARDLSSHYRRPFPVTLAKLLLGRVLFGRGPQEFNEYRFAIRPVWDWRRYVVERERERMQEAAAPPGSRGIEENKVRFWARCVDNGLPTVPLTAVIVAATASGFPGTVPVVRSGTELRALLEPLGDFDGFAKPLGGGQGYGAFTFALQRGVLTAPARLRTPEELFDHCSSSAFGRGGYLLQPRMRPHPALHSVMPGPGLGTIRLVTFLQRDGNVVIPWAVMKIPAPGQIVCNPRLGALIVPLDQDSGRLHPAVGPTADTYVVHEHVYHPVTRSRFSDVVVPEWSGILSMVRRAADVFSELPCLGWDVAVTDQGPMLLETNWAFGIYTQQIALGRGLRSELRQLFSSCAGT